jgi:hypothetical protein
MKTVTYKSINFIIGYTFGKIQQFWLGMCFKNHQFDGSVVVVPKSWFGLFEDCSEPYRKIIQNVETLFNDLVNNYNISFDIKETDNDVGFHYIIRKLPDVKKMTVADIEKELGYKIEIISE